MGRQSLRVPSDHTQMVQLHGNVDSSLAVPIAHYQAQSSVSLMVMQLHGNVVTFLTAFTALCKVLP